MIRAIIVAIALHGLHSATMVQAAVPLSGGDFAVSRATIDGGGGDSAGGVFAVRGTVGQADVGTSSGAALALRSGFWTTTRLLSPLLFRDGFEVAIDSALPQGWIAGVSRLPATPLGPGQYSHPGS